MHAPVGAMRSEELESLCQHIKEGVEQVLPKALLAKLQLRPDYKLPREWWTCVHVKQVRKSVRLCESVHTLARVYAALGSSANSAGPCFPSC